MRSPDYEYLDRFILGLGRKMMRGKATITTKLEDGTEKKRTVDRRKVWDFLGLVPSATELHARRRQWYQNLMKDPTVHQNVLFSFFGEASFESDTIFDESGRIRESSCGEARQWQEDVDGLGVFDDGAVFLERGGGAVGQWFLDSGLREDFGILDMNGIRAAYRAIKKPPPCLGGRPVLIPPESDEQEDLAPERPHVCPERNDSFETLRQLVAHQTHKHGHRHPPGIVTVTNTSVWCRNIYRDRRATYLHHQQSWKRGYCTGRGSHLHTVVIPVNTSCSHSDQHFESVAMLLEHLRTVFPLERNAELGLDAVVRNVGGEATENETPSRRTGAAEPRHTEANAAHSVPPGLETRSGDSRAVGGNLPHIAGEARRTVDAGEQRSHGALYGKIEGGTETSGRAARLWMGGHDDGHDHGPSTLRAQPESGDIHVQCELTGDSLAEHLLEPVQKKFRRTGSSGSVQWTPRLSPSCASSWKAMKSRGAKEKFGQAPAGSNARELQHMLDDL